MEHRRVGSGIAAAVLFCSLLLPAGPARAQSRARLPMATPDDNATIVAPLREIGRVRARTPYCSALARARPGIDAALTYEYAVPTVARDLRTFRFDSGLTKEHSLNTAERDLSKLWDIATVGRADVLALRDAALAEIDPRRRDEMMALANAVDGARGRQQQLARSLSRVLGTFAETPVYSVANARHDDPGRTAFASRPGLRDIAPFVPPLPTAVTETQADEIEHATRLDSLFRTFEVEHLIRNDLKDAATHATTVIELGGCTTGT